MLIIIVFLKTKNYGLKTKLAEVAELVDAHDSKSCVARHAGSIPALGTNKMKKVLVILGQTATGKSDLAVDLAKKYNGEIISADSRQVYKGLDLGTGKITRKEMQNIPHHLLDIASPKTRFTVADFKRKAEKAITDIHSRNKLPIICGGTAFYIDAVINGMILPEVAPNTKLRIKLNKKDLDNLIKQLERLDPERANTIDSKNKIRVIRAIEIAVSLGKVPKLKTENKYDVLKIGVKWPQKVLDQRIHDRLIKRIKTGMISEVKKLHEQGLSWKRMIELGLEYRYLALYLASSPRQPAGVNKPKIKTEKELIFKLETAIKQFSKRQMTWWKRDQEIKWFRPDQEKEIMKEVERWV
jgi:tRNA dimethylallyltransferase